MSIANSSLLPYKIIDSNESPGRRLFFTGRGWEQKRLKSGDYAFRTYNGFDVGIELKLMPDFLKSLTERLPRQLHDMLEDYYLVTLMIVGSWEESNGFLIAGNETTSFTWSFVWNFLQTWQDQGISIQLCHDENHACERILSLCGYYQKVIHTGGYTRRYIGDARVMALTACNGIGEEIAKNLMKHFGTLSAVATASSGDLSKVEGMGPKRVTELISHFHFKGI
jgi:ERCC4-type nuclease